MYIEVDKGVGNNKNKKKQKRNLASGKKTTSSNESFSKM